MVLWSLESFSLEKLFEQKTINQHFTRLQYTKNSSTCTFLKSVTDI